MLISPVSGVFEAARDHKVEVGRVKLSAMISRLRRDDTLLLIIDVQTRLLPAMHEAQSIERNCALLCRAARWFEMTIVVTEQNPTRLGATTDAVKTVLGGFEPVAKMSFSAYPDARTQIENRACKTVLLCGLESHVCVLQTGLDLIEAGYTVFLVEDAISSRHQSNRRIGLERLKLAGALPTSVESALFELMQSAEDADFKAILTLIK